MMELVSLQEEEETQSSLSAICGHSKKVAVCKPRREHSPDLMGLAP